MNLQFSFEGGDSWWSVKKVFNQFYNEFITNNTEHNISFLDSSLYYDKNPSSFFSPHIMVIKNLENEKYIIVSYWDRAFDLTFKSNGWDNEKCVNIITSSGVFNDLEFTPFTYLPYNCEYDNLSKDSKSIFEKENNELFFRGKLYGDRLSLSKTNKIKIVDNIVDIHNYFNELNSNKISLSLNGAGEICNRDIEILLSKSVLFRPELKQKFHNPLIPGYHYIAFEYNDDPQTQSEIILNKFQEIKDDLEYLQFISENGYKWYIENGSVGSNVKLLNKIVKLEKLL